MEYDRASVASRSGERPVTRWRREQPSEPTTPHPDQQQQRPLSRRGVKTDISEYGISRPPTSGKGSATSRPASPALNNRPGSTASSRIGTPSARVNSGLPRNFAHQPPSAMIIDRPITQQGLVGVRPASARAMPRLARQIQDKMYYKQLLQMKIQELNQEITSIAGQVGGTSVEMDKYQYYNGMTGDSAIMTTATAMDDSQDNFDDYGAMETELDVEQEARTLKEINDSIEDVWTKQRHARKKLDELAKEIEFKRKIAEKFADSMDAETKAKYDEAFQVKIDLQREIDRMQEDHEKLVKRQGSVKEKIANSPMKQEIYELYNKLSEAADQKRRSNSFEEEEEEGNGDIDRAEQQIMEIEKKIADAQQELEELDADGEPDNQEDLKFNEAPQRPKTAKHRTEQLLAKLNSLEEQIANRLERLSNNMNENTDSAQLNDEDMEMFAELMEQNFDNKSSKSYEELKQDYLKLSQASSKLEILESKIFAGKSKPMKGQADILEINDRMQEVESNNNFYAESESYDQRFKKRNYDKLIEKIENNEIHRFISVLETKLQKPSLESDQASSTEGKTEDADNLSLMKVMMDLTSQYNAVLINNMKLIY